MRPTDKFAFPAEKDVQKKQNEIVLDKWEAIAQGRKEGQVVKQVQQGGKAGGHWSITFEEFKKGLEPYTLDFVAELSKREILTKAWKTSRRNWSPLLILTLIRPTIFSASGVWELTNIKEAYG